MASVRTTFRTTLEASLAAALAIPFVGAPIEGPVADRDIGCVWWEGKRPMGRDGNEEENYYRIRVFRRWQQQQGLTDDQALLAPALEDSAELLEAALKAVLTTTGHQFFTVTEVTADYGRECVEAQILAYDRNRSAAGG